uniref:Reverse transcriptase/retrotransposon-derived protein RNase H-like domain-containing protein n=1 Tax=Amphilophus citrinellus TaxID=61819 RepID=A0A3Q0RE67_AMPCI
CAKSTHNNLRLVSTKTVGFYGLQPDHDRVTAVIHAPAPHDMFSLRSFLGLASWYSKFIPVFATVSEPLRTVRRDSTDLHFKWTAEAESSFTALKELIVNSSALALYDPELPTYVTTDASDYDLDEVLTQLHSAQSERVVAFASRTLSPAERKYSTVECEALAYVKWPYLFKVLELYFSGQITLCQSPHSYSYQSDPVPTLSNT